MLGAVAWRRPIQSLWRFACSGSTRCPSSHTCTLGSRGAIYVEETILALPRIYINGGARGFLVALAPSDLARVLKPTTVQVAI
jgi:hypothetical protein